MNKVAVRAPGQTHLNQSVAWDSCLRCDVHTLLEVVACASRCTEAVRMPKPAMLVPIALRLLHPSVASQPWEAVLALHQGAHVVFDSALSPAGEGLARLVSISLCLQVVFAVIAPRQVVPNLVAGAIAEAGANQAGDMMQVVFPDGHTVMFLKGCVLHDQCSPRLSAASRALLPYFCPHKLVSPSCLCKNLRPCIL